VPGEHFVDIARIVIALRCEDPRIRWRWSGAMERFVVPPAAADVNLSVGFLDDFTRYPSGTLLFESGGVWRMFRDGAGFRIECRTYPGGDAPYKVALLNDAFTHGRVLLAAHAAPESNPLEYPLDEVLIAHLLGRGRGVELHSCGIIDHDGRGHLFAGASGAGKTTTARLWQTSGAAASIISDDRVIVREHEGALRMYGTPWHGEAELSAAAAAPLAGIYLLQQADTNELRELSAIEAVPRLFGCAFPPFHDASAVDFTLSFLARMCERVTVRELRFTRDARAVELVARP
jgi:hypothetical protein